MSNNIEGRSSSSLARVAAWARQLLGFSHCCRILPLRHSELAYLFLNRLSI